MGRKKLEVGTTVKEKIFKLLDELDGGVSYNMIKVVSLKENTFKTILSQWRKERGIVVQKGRRKKVGVNHEAEK